jgi:hypothetical protein
VSLHIIQLSREEAVKGDADTSEEGEKEKVTISFDRNSSKE